MSSLYQEKSATSAKIEQGLLSLAAQCDLDSSSVSRALMQLLTNLEAIPSSTFIERPEYVRITKYPVVVAPEPTVSSKHTLFEVISARSSRRDFATNQIDVGRLLSVVAWSVGKKGTNLAYDRADAPLRYTPSAGGLNCIDAYVIVNSCYDLAAGTYYYDHDEGLKLIRKGRMIEKVADLYAQPRWVRRSAAVLVFVANIDRLDKKYGPLSAKLAMLDAGVAVGHAELVATALELRATILGALPADGLARLLEIDPATRIPIVSLALGTRGED